MEKIDKNYIDSMLKLIDYTKPEIVSTFVPDKVSENMINIYTNIETLSKVRLALPPMVTVDGTETTDDIYFLKTRLTPFSTARRGVYDFFKAMDKYVKSILPKYFNSKYKYVPFVEADKTIKLKLLECRGEFLLNLYDFNNDKISPGQILPNSNFVSYVELDCISINTETKEAFSDWNIMQLKILTSYELLGNVFMDSKYDIDMYDDSEKNIVKSEEKSDNKNNETVPTAPTVPTTVPIIEHIKKEPIKKSNLDSDEDIRTKSITDSPKRETQTKLFAPKHEEILTQKKLLKKIPENSPAKSEILNTIKEEKLKKEKEEESKNKKPFITILKKTEKDNKAVPETIDDSKKMVKKPIKVGDESKKDESKKIVKKVPETKKDDNKKVIKKPIKEVSETKKDDSKKIIKKPNKEITKTKDDSKKIVKKPIKEVSETKKDDSKKIIKKPIKEIPKTKDVGKKVIKKSNEE